MTTDSSCKAAPDDFTGRLYSLAVQLRESGESKATVVLRGGWYGQLRVFKPELQPESEPTEFTSDGEKP